MTILAQRGPGIAHRLRRLHALTPDEADNQLLARKVLAAIRGGAKAVQYRNKSAASSTRREHALALLARCRAHAVPLIINDDHGLARDLDTDGVHLGEEDGSPEAAARRLGPGKILGASCYNRLPAVFAAQCHGATYVAFGSIFPSSVKPAAISAPLPLLHKAKTSFAIPIGATGGITVNNDPALAGAGADSVAVISALFGASEVEAAARQISPIFPD